MGITAIPSQQMHVIPLGIAAVSNQAPLLRVGNQVYVNGFRQYYNIGYRCVFPGIASDGMLALYCHSIIYGQDLPPLDLSDVEVYSLG